MPRTISTSYGIKQTTFPFQGDPRVLAEFPSRDVDILRGLARRKMEIAEDPLNLERRRLWYRHNGLAPERPMVLAEIQGCLSELERGGHLVLQCRNDLARAIEYELRKEQYEFDVLKDDHVVEPWIDCNWIVHTRTADREHDEKACHV